MGFEPTGARACSREGWSLPDTLCDTTLVSTGASSVSVSLEEEMILCLPGFLLGLYGEAIAEEVEKFVVI